MPGPRRGAFPLALLILIVLAGSVSLAVFRATEEEKPDQVLPTTPPPTTVSPTASPTLQPTESPSPTVSPTASPTISPTPTESPSPSPSPTDEEPPLPVTGGTPTLWLGLGAGLMGLGALLWRFRRPPA